MGGSSQTTESHAMTEKLPTKEAQKYLDPLYQQGWGFTNNIPQDYVAQANPLMQSGAQQIANVAPTMGTTGQPLVDMATRIARGEFLDPNNDPTFAGLRTATVNPLLDTLRNQVLPGLTGQAIQAGGVGGGPSAFGGASLGIPQESALNDFSKAATDAVARAASQSRLAGMSLIPQAGNIAAQGEQLKLLPGTVTGQAGEMQRSFTQMAIDDALKRYGTGQDAQQKFANLLATGGWGTQEQNATSKTTQETSTAAQILQGLSGAAGIAGAMFGVPAGGTSAFSGIMNLFKGFGSPTGGGQPSNPYYSGGWTPAPYAA
jgi:hypothetical protein